MALFSQQIYFDGLKKYFNVISNDKEKKNQSYFSYLCFTAFPAYFIYIGINYFFKDYYYENFFLLNIYIYLTFTLISIILYIFYSFAFETGQKILKDDLSKKYYRLCGYLIYCETQKLKVPNTIEMFNQFIENREKNAKDNIITNEENKNEVTNDNKNKDIDRSKLFDEFKEAKNKEELSLKIDIGDDNISIKNSNFVITQNHSNDDIEFKNNNVDYFYFEDDPCCPSCKLGCRKLFKLVKESQILSCLFLCNCFGDCVRNIPETLTDCCKCDTDCCRDCQDFLYELCECCDCGFCFCCCCGSFCYEICCCCPSFEDFCH